MTVGHFDLSSPVFFTLFVFYVIALIGLAIGLLRLIAPRLFVGIDRRFHAMSLWQVRAIMWPIKTLALGCIIYIAIGWLVGWPYPPMHWTIIIFIFGSMFTWRFTRNGR